MIDPFAGRVSELNEAPVRSGSYVLYWMQQSQRARWNHALEYAAEFANSLSVPVLVGFGLTADYPDATLRHYRFMLEGLAETARDLAERGVGFVLRIGEPPGVALDLGRNAAAIVCDRGYLRHQREWRYHVARTASCRVIEVESELVVPVEEVSLKQEYAARTIRPKIHRRLGEFLLPLPEIALAQRWPSSGRDPEHDARPRGEQNEDVEALLEKLGPRSEPGSVSGFFRGGQPEAERRLALFRDERLEEYEEQRSEPGADVSSNLSPYLHFGQISSLQVALELGAREFVAGLEAGKGEMKNQPGSVGIRVDGEKRKSARDAFLEELLVRRGLAHNYVWYQRDYDSYDALPDWARTTLADHESDERPVLYDRGQLVACDTHDEHWNNAMAEMVTTGYMHNYMRMYWAKKILEWSATPSEAYETALELNNRYFLDGRDPNSYANVAWTFGLHDRPWTEREIFGKVRYMNANGLKRKFDMDRYALKVQRLTGRSGQASG